MGYDFYMGKTLLPVAPKKLQLKIGNANKTVTLINEGEINILKTPGLTDIDFEILLPNTEYGFAKYKDGFKPAEYFLEKLRELKNKKSFQFIVFRQFPNGKLLHGTNMKVSIEDYTIKEDADDGFDTVVTIRLKQYRDYGTKTCNVVFSGSKPTATINQSRAVSDNAPSGGTYTVKTGDSLWKIAATQLGSGSYWNSIYSANRNVIGANPNKIYPGQVLTIPKNPTKRADHTTGGSKTNAPFTILTSSFGVVRSNIATWNEALGYYNANGGKGKGWKIVDANKNIISL